MFIAPLFTIANTWRQPKCPSTENWIRKMWYVYTMEYHSAIKNNKVMPFEATWMELETLILSEERKRQIPYDITYIWHLIFSTNISFHRKENYGL